MEERKSIVLASVREAMRHWRIFGILWLLVTIIGVLGHGDSFGESAWKASRALFMGTLFSIFVSNASSIGKFPAWKAKSAVSFVTIFAAFGLALAATNDSWSGPNVAKSWLAAGFGSITLWLTMCCVDSLQSWAKTPLRMMVAVPVLFVLLSGWFAVCVLGAVWLWGKYA